MSFSLVIAALLSVPGIGRVSALKIIEKFSQHHQPIEYKWGTAQWRKIVEPVVNEKVLTSLQTFQKQWSLSAYQDYLEKKQIQLISFKDEVYPSVLSQISDFPLVLFAKGNLECLRPRHVAVVGSRRPTRYGRWAAERLVSQLVSEDVSIVSGFMIGIDYQAHQTAQLLGGRSVGVLGFGFDHFYPLSMAKAADKFLEAGQLLVSEYPPETSPVGGQFAARNRIVAGMSAATVVVEAQHKSGSLITAQCALDNGRCVGAVPGPIDSALSDGTHHLIREGALLIRSGEDLLTEMAPLQTVRVLVQSPFSPGVKFQSMP